MVQYWHNECVQKEQKQTEFIPNRFERLGRQTDRVKGDDTLKQLIELFTNGFGIDWSPVQIKIFNYFIDSILPRIYLKEWDEVKPRVMMQRNLKEMYQETLVNMARRNGKVIDCGKTQPDSIHP